jgi:hypothetical protein
MIPVERAVFLPIFMSQKKMSLFRSMALNREMEKQELSWISRERVT